VTFDAGEGNQGYYWEGTGQGGTGGISYVNAGLVSGYAMSSNPAATAGYIALSW
jgi:hypothetical protein